MLQLIAAHPAPFAALCIAVAIVSAAAALIVAASDRADRRAGRHSRGVYRGTPAEIRRHRARGRALTWTRTVSVRPDRTSTTHVLDLTSEDSVRHRAALRYEDTGEITQATLDALFRPRPALTGATT